MSDPIMDLFESVPGSKPRAVDAKPEPAVFLDGWDAGYVTKMHQGKATRFYTIGHLAAALDRKPVTVRSWEDKGWLPQARYRDRPPKKEQLPDKKSIGRRLYTREQIEVVVKAAQDFQVLVDNGRSARWQLFTQAVITGWQALS